MIGKEEKSLEKEKKDITMRHLETDRHSERERRLDTICTCICACVNTHVIDLIFYEYT